VDNLTHTLFGATLARTPLGRAGRGTTAALLLASNAPDIDILATAGGAAKYLEWHRGLTHGPLGIVGLGVISATIVEMARRLNPKWRHADDAPFGMLVAASIAAVFFHVLMDVPTSYGTRFLAPFSWRWYGLDWLPIIDIYLLIALVAGLFFGRITEAARRRNVIITLFVVAVIYGVRGASHWQALDIAPRLFGPTLPPRCDSPPDRDPPLDSWPQPVPSPPAPGSHRCLVEIAALPTFTSPFDWRIVARMSNAYEIHDINVLDSRFQEPAAISDGFWRQVRRYPNIWTPIVADAARTPLGQVFLGFSRFPAARSAIDARGATTVRFTDVRFVGGALGNDQPLRRVQLFTATIRFDAQGRLVSSHLGQ
jgi:membrane-bound metal-dependent hydrolase YbcI (DUF457 family)